MVWSSELSGRRMRHLGLRSTVISRPTEHEEFLSLGPDEAAKNTCRTEDETGLYVR
jgi:hypothetical protein